MPKSIIPDPSKIPGEVTDLDEQKANEQKPVDKEAKPAQKLDPMAPLKDAKTEDKPVEDKKTEEKPKDNPESPVEEKDPVLVELESLRNAAAQATAKVKEFQEKYENKKKDLDRLHGDFNLEKATNNDLKKEVVRLNDQMKKREEAAWGRVNKYVDKADEGVKAFVAIVKTNDMSADELLAKIEEARSKGLIPGIGDRPQPDNNSAVAPTSKDKAKGKKGDLLYNHAQHQAFFDAMNKMGKPKE